MHSGVKITYVKIQFTLHPNDPPKDGLVPEKEYLKQKRKKMIACPMCDDTGIRRAPSGSQRSAKRQAVKKTTQHS